MNDEKFKRLFKKARALACRWGFEGDADDIAQEACIRAYEHGGIRIEWVLSDYLRKKYGRPGTPGGDAKRTGILGGLSLDAPSKRQEEDSEPLHTIIGGAEHNPDYQLELRDLHKFIGKRDGRDEEIFRLYCEGATEKEIGKALGITEPRVSQLIKRMVEYAEAMIMILEITPIEARKWVLNYAFKNRK